MRCQVSVLNIAPLCIQHILSPTKDWEGTPPEIITVSNGAQCYFNCVSTWEGSGQLHKHFALLLHCRCCHRPWSTTMSGPGTHLLVKKMTGGTPEVRSDKSLTLLTWTNGPMDQRTNGPMDQWSNGPMDRWTNGQMDQWSPDIPKISRRYPQDIPKISKRYSQDIPKISQDILKIS